jgi:hypothetical protein
MSEEVSFTVKVMLSLLVINLTAVMFAGITAGSLGMGKQLTGFNNLQSNLQTTTTNLANSFNDIVNHNPNNNPIFDFINFIGYFAWDIGMFLFNIIALIFVGIVVILYMVFAFIPSLLVVGSTYLGVFGYILSGAYEVTAVILSIYGFSLVLRIIRGK